jgi:hypothetical protein
VHLLWPWIAATACTHEDLTVCDNVQVSFYINTSITTNVTTDIDADIDGDAGGLALDTLHSVYIYVVNAQDEFVDMHRFSEVAVNTEYRLDFKLPADTYDFIVWTSQETPYSVNFDTSGVLSADETTRSIPRSDKQFALTVDDTRRVGTLIPRLFYGKLEDHVVSPNNKQLISIPLVENTNTIDITVNGLQQHGGENDLYELTITDDNHQYDFNNSFVAGGDPIHYVASLSHEPGETTLHTTLRTLKLAADRSPIVSLRNVTRDETYHLSYDDAGQPVPLNLVALIRRAYNNNVSFNRRHYFLLTLDFHADMSVTIGLDGWELTDNGYPLFN